jgi:transposase-like protein
MIQSFLEQEMEQHLEYEKHSLTEDLSINTCNGKNLKNFTSSLGSVAVEVPRDRKSKFKPQVVKKRQNDISSFDDKIICIEIFPTTVSNITNKVVDVALKQQSRVLFSIYAIVFSMRCITQLRSKVRWYIKRYKLVLELILKKRDFSPLGRGNRRNQVLD